MSNNKQVPYKFDVTGVPNLVYAESTRGTFPGKPDLEYCLETGICEFPPGMQTLLFKDEQEELDSYAVEDSNLHSFDVAMPLTVLVYCRVVLPRFRVNGERRTVHILPTIYAGWTNDKSLFYEDGFSSIPIPALLPNVEPDGRVCSGADTEFYAHAFNASMARAVDQWKFAPGNQDLSRLCDLYADGGKALSRWQTQSRASLSKGIDYIYRCAVKAAEEDEMEPPTIRGTINDLQGVAIYRATGMANAAR